MAAAEIKERVRPLFLADWDRALFLHFEVDIEELRRRVPFELDLFEDRSAIVTLVAFTMRGMRMWRGGRWTRWMTSPIATHSFLNLRTYVRGRDREPGIYFMREWLNSRLAVLLGPITFGLPYRLGSIDYHHDFESGNISGAVVLFQPFHVANLALQPALFGNLPGALRESPGGEFSGVAIHQFAGQVDAFPEDRAPVCRFSVFSNPGEGRGGMNPLLF